MEKFRNSLQFSSPTTAELLFTFATVLARSGSDQQLINLSVCPQLRSFLFSLTVHSSPSSRLNQTAMLAPSRNTTEQRYQTDALELDNDSGSLTACGNQASKTGSLSVKTEDLRQPDQLTSASVVMGDRADHLLLFSSLLEAFALDSEDLGAF
jgi:hypothetical protein